MPRRSSLSSSRSSSSSFHSFRPSSKIAQSPSTANVSTPVQHNIKVEQPSFFSNMWQGFGLGAGQAIAHNIFRSNPVVQHVHTPQPQPSTTSTQKSTLEENLPKEFVQCMKEYDNNKDLCKQYLN